jgi:hypothetical protein
MPKKRDYGSEYRNYQGKPKQKKDRAKRNAARRKMEKAGKVRKGDNLDVDHKRGIAAGNGKSNLVVKNKAKNRSFPRTKTARKKKK